MTIKPLTDDDINLAVAAWRETITAELPKGSVLSAANTLGISRNALSNRLFRAAQRGIIPIDETTPGFITSKVSITRDKSGEIARKSITLKPESKSTFAVPNGQIIKGISALIDGQGNVQAKWVKTGADQSAESAVELIKSAFEGWQPSSPYIAKPESVLPDLLNLYPLPDMHLGLLAWQAETGADWDLKIADKVYRETISDVSHVAPRAGTGVVLIGGDYFHANTNEFRSRSGHVFDGDGRVDKIVKVGVDLAVFQINSALKSHEKVIVRILKGNHDEYLIISLVWAIWAWYRENPRVHVDLDPSLFWYFQFGKVFLAAHHGHETKVHDMPMGMATRHPTIWGDTIYRYAHMFHIHHKTQMVFEGGGVIAESHQAPVQQDAHHFGKSYLSGRSMQVITYEKNKGEVSRNIVRLS
jgi:hypothetical protein